MEVSYLAELDDHICVYCRRKINGLNNYITHIKACEPLGSFYKKSTPRLPLIRTPSRESLQSEVHLESLAGSRCSSSDNYMQRIYDDMYRYEKEVLEYDSGAEVSCMEESEDSHYCGENVNKSFESTRLLAASCPTVECAESAVDCRTKKSHQKVSNESEVNLSSTFSEKMAPNPKDSVISRSYDNVSMESGLSLSCLGNGDEGTSKNSCAAAQYLLGVCSPLRMLGNSCGCGLGCLDNVVSECRKGDNGMLLMENDDPSAGTDSGSIDQQPFQNIPVSTKHDKVGPVNPSLSSGFAKSSDEGITIYKVWGDNPESLASSFKECLLEIFSALSSRDKKKVFDEVEKICDSYNKSGGKIQIKIVEATNKMNLLIKKIEGEEEHDNERISSEGSATEKDSVAVPSAAHDGPHKLMTNLPECTLQRTGEMNIDCGRAGDNESVHKFVEERKENVPIAAPEDGSAINAPKEEYLKSGNVPKSGNDTTVSLKDVHVPKNSEESDFKEECVPKSGNISLRQDPLDASLAEASCKDSVACGFNSDTANKVFQESLWNKEGILTAPNTHNSNVVLPNSPWRCSLKEITNVVFKKVQKSSRPGIFWNAGDDSMKTLEHNTIAACTTNKVIKAKKIPNTTIVSQKNHAQNTNTTEVSRDSYVPKNLISSRGKMMKQLSSTLSPSPWHDIADIMFFNSVKDVGLEVEIGPNGMSSFVSEDSPMKQVSSLQIPLKSIQRQAKRRRRGHGRRRRGWKKGQNVRGIKKGSSGEQFAQEDSQSRCKRRGRSTDGGCRDRISLRSLSNIKGETGSDSFRVDQVSKMGLQRYHLRIRRTEGCTTTVPAEVAGKIPENTLTTQENQDSSVKLSHSRLLDEFVDSQMHSRRGFGRRGKSKRVTELVSIAKDVVHLQELGQEQAVMHPKETSLDPNNDHLDGTAHSKCVEDQVDSVSKPEVVTKKDSGRGFNDLPLQKMQETRCDDVVNNLSRYFSKRKRKMELIADKRMMQHRKVSRVGLRRCTTRSPVPSSEFIRTRSGYSLRQRVSQPLYDEAAFVSSCSEEDGDFQQERLPIREASTRSEMQTKSQTSGSCESESTSFSSDTSNQNLVIEEMPTLIPETSLKKEANDPKTFNHGVIKTYRVPGMVEKIIDGDERRVSSRLIDDDEVQIVLEFIKPRKQSHINGKDRGKVESIEWSKKYMAESSCSQHISLFLDCHTIKREERITSEENATSRLCSTDSAMASRTPMLLVNEKDQLENMKHKAEIPAPESGLSNIVVMDVRSGAELTEEERNILPEIKCDKLSEILGQTSNHNEVNEKLVVKDGEINTVHIRCTKKYDSPHFSRERVLVNAPCLGDSSITESVLENVVNVAGCDNFDKPLPDVGMVSHSNLSYHDTKKKESTLGKYIKGSYSEVTNLESLRLPGHNVDSSDVSIQVEKVIPLITLAPDGAQRIKNQMSQSSLSKPQHSNMMKVTNQLIIDHELHRIERKYTSGVYPTVNHFRDSLYSVPDSKTIPHMMISHPKLSKGVANPTAPSDQMDQVVHQSSDFRNLLKGNNSSAIPPNPTSASSDSHNDASNVVHQGSLVMNLPETVTSPPNITFKVQSSSMQSGEQDTIVFQSSDQSKFIEFLKQRKLDNFACTSSQASTVEAVNHETSDISVGQHQLIKLGEVISSDQYKVKELVNVLARSSGMKMMLTQAGKNQHEKFILYGIEEERPETIKEVVLLE